MSLFRVYFGKIGIENDEGGLVWDIYAKKL